MICSSLPGGSNPLLADWSAEPFGLPPFSRIKPEHFRPAFDRALASNLDEIRSIAERVEPASFENTALALDRWTDSPSSVKIPCIKIGSPMH